VFFAIIPVLLLQILLAIGLGMVSGILNVFFRDVGQFVTIAMQFWFWLTPIVYPASILPVEARPVLDYNPMAAVVQAHQAILVEGRLPDWNSLIPAGLLAVLLCILGLRLFRKRSGEMVDEL
jgi:lipopolysaccharide transport system permease protein